MKTKLALIFLLIPFQFIFSQNVDDSLVNLIIKQDYLALNKRYQSVKDGEVSEVVKLLTEMYLHSAFNRFDESNEAASTLLAKHQAEMGMNAIVACIATIGDNYKRQGNYLESANILQSFLDQTVTFDGVEEQTRNSLKELTLWKALGNDLKPEIIRPDRDCEIPYYNREGGLKSLMYVDVALNGNKVSFVFDTGADGYDTQTVSESFARKNGIRILEDSVIIAGTTGSGYVRLGMTDSIQIGDIVYRNVAFTIIPGDNILPGDVVVIDAVLGSGFMKAMGEMQFYPKEKKIVFPYKESELPEGGSNMVFVGGQPYVEGYNGDRRLYLHFDTGADKDITLSSKYYREHKEEVEATGWLHSDAGRVGFGGIMKIDQYILPVFRLKAGTKEKDFNDIWVLTDTENSPVGDGAIGADFISECDKVTVNYNKMFTTFE